MQDCRVPHRRRSTAKRLGLWLAPLAVLLAAGAAHAQTSPACERFKGTLAKRISGSFTLEDVPADAPLPPGAKAVATCEGGARKILLIRPGRDTAPAASAAASAADTPPAATASAPAPRTRPAEVRATTPRSVTERVQTPPPVASAVELPRPFDTAPAATPSPSRDEITPAATPLRERATAWLAQRWPWLLAPLLLLLAAIGWAWLSHRSAYDAAGLPRGPRLN
jgi:hypothetical protein